MRVPAFVKATLHLALLVLAGRISGWLLFPCPPELMPFLLVPIFSFFVVTGWLCEMVQLDKTPLKRGKLYPASPTCKALGFLGPFA